MKEQVEYMESLRAIGKSYREIANDTNYVFQTNYWDAERVRDKFRKIKKKENKIIANQIVNKLSECKNSNYNVFKVKRNKVLVLSDLHIPFHRNDLFEIVEKHKNEIKAIICPGDVLDMFEISKYPSVDQFPVEQELISAIDVFTKIRNIVGNEVDIILCYGNHDARWRKYIANMHQKKLYKFINPNVLEMLKSGFTLYENGEERHYEGIKDLTIVNSWYVNINHELICCHPNNFSTTEIKNAKNAIEHFISCGEKFNVVAVAHNHHQGEVPKYLGKYAIETGCMCQEFDYSNGNTKARPQDYGYALFSFDENGKISKNESRVYTLDCERKMEDKSFIQINI